MPTDRKEHSTSTVRVKLNDPFWSRYTALVRHNVIPYQWEALNDRIPGADPSYAMRNFRIAAGREEGEHGGHVFQDSDLYKWLEAVGHFLASGRDEELERWADEAIELIGAAQQSDGYINTYFTLVAPERRWSFLIDSHELYCAGHLIEAAVAYYEATAKRKILDIVCRFADYIETVFGRKPGQIRGYDGHQEIELALVKLYRTTGEKRYLQLSQYFIEERGQEPNFFQEEWEANGHYRLWSRGAGSKPNNSPYHQAHLPVREQTVAVGHAVRAVYMYTAMADLARLTEDAGLAHACRTLWRNMTRKQMYITGGIGSTHHGEAFTFDYDLPNDTVYAETCASIGLVFFARRMLQIEVDRDYADVMERALYNTVIAGMSQDGRSYFYVNPLEVWPAASDQNPSRRHVKPVRRPWFGCSCCPPNVARLLASLGQYLYTVDEETRTIYSHLFIGSEAEITVGSDQVRLEQQSGLPWNGEVRFIVRSQKPATYTLSLRIPAWADGKPVMRVNGVATEYESVAGYARVERTWSDSDQVEWSIPLIARLIEARPEIRANAGKVALERGPLVYAFEEADNLSPITSLSLAYEGEIRELPADGLPAGAIALEADGYLDAPSENGDDAPYRIARHAFRQQTVRAVPYFLWGNRAPGEMIVWIRSK